MQTNEKVPNKKSEQKARQSQEGTKERNKMFLKVRDVEEINK
jgi:hypothetical protein